MSEHEADQLDEEQLRQRLAEVDGVEAVLLDPERRQVWLVLRAGADPQRLEEQVQPLAEPFTLQLVIRPDRRDRQRVRFLALNRDVRTDQQSELQVVLEWGGREYEGSAVGDARGAAELRTAASAALAAVLAIVPNEMDLRLAGVKQVRAFDEDLIMVSLYRSEGAPRNLVGVVVAGEDPRRAAAVAVLNALNRLLGNYLQLP